MRKKIYTVLIKSTINKVYTIVLVFVFLFCNTTINAQDFSKIKKQAKKGNAEMQHLLASYYYYGKYVDKDTMKAIYWYEKAVQGGNEDAKVDLALCFHNRKDYGKAYPLFLSYIDNSSNKESKNYRYNTALRLVGAYKMDGLSTPIDKPGAVKYLEEAHKNGANVEMDLHICYEYLGEDEKCFLIAKEEYEKTGVPFNLSKDYLFGIGCKQDLSKVRELLQEMSDGKLVYYAPDGGRIRYSNTHLYAAKCYIGISYYFDKNKKNHYQEAVKYLTEVIESKEATEFVRGQAMCALQRCYRFGRGVKKDIARANELEKEAKVLLPNENYDNFSKRFKSSY